MKRLLALLLLTTPLLAEAPPVYAGRPYHAPLTPAETKDIDFIITTLADKPYTKLLFCKSQIVNAGARIEHVHPLKFCIAIFADEKLKVGIRNMRKKSLVWREFVNDLGDSFARERAQDNLLPEYIEHFAGYLEIDPGKIRSSLENRRWETFINLLIEIVPREEGTDRYDF